MHRAAEDPPQVIKVPVPGKPEYVSWFPVFVWDSVTELTPSCRLATKVTSPLLMFHLLALMTCAMKHVTRLVFLISHRVASRCMGQ